MVHHDRFQLPIALQMIGTTRAALLKLVPGKTSELELVLEPTPAEIEEQQVAPTEIAGTVVGPDGKPLAGVEVDVWHWHPGNETKTDKRGRFRLKGFEPGAHLEILFTKSGLEPRYFFDEPAGASGWVIKMDDRTYLEGTVNDPDGQAVPGAIIRAERGPFQNPEVHISEVPTETRTDDNGLYRLYLEPATYSIKVRVPSRGVARFEGETIAAGEQRKFDIKLNEGITFRAKFIDSESGKPVEGMQLFSWRLKGIEGTSNADGVIEIPDLFPGRVEFQVAAAGNDKMHSGVAGNYARWWSEQAAEKHQRKQTEEELQDRRKHGHNARLQNNWDDLTFDIADREEPVTIYVEPCVMITGRVIDPEGKPVAGATATAAQTGTGNSLTGDTRYSYTTKKDGTFEMRLPASGQAQYNLVAHDGKYDQWRNWANTNGVPFSTTPGQKIENVDLQLARPATIRGRVLNDDGTPTAGTEVSIADPERRDNRYYIPKTKTDDEGRFEIKFVAPGKQVIQAEWAWLNADMVPTTTNLKHLDVEEGATIDDVELRLAPQGANQFIAQPVPVPAE
jgi:protocatechuate 3,4-dioxygenase beta subunit